MTTTDIEDLTNCGDGAQPAGQDTTCGELANLIIPEIRDFVPDAWTIETIEKVVYEMIKTPITSYLDMRKFLSKHQKITHMVLSTMKILYVYKNMIQSGKIVRHKEYEKFLVSKKVRGASGVTVVTVATSPWPSSAEDEYFQNTLNEEYLTTRNQKLPKLDERVNKEGTVNEVFTHKTSTTLSLANKNKNFSCKYDCFYCPSEPGQPRSYLLKEPGIARANQYRFDAVCQFRDRGNSYLVNGHEFDKIELIILGGTWSSYPKDYQESFIRDLYFAANTFYDGTGSSSEEDLSNETQKADSRERLTLEEEIKLNETSMCRIIGLTLETRPNEVTLEELKRFRRFGCTRVQLGVQHTDDNILKYINRGCTIDQVKKAIWLLKDNCFKVDIHLMPDLPSSDVDKDYEMFKTVLNDPMLQADQWKVYPCAVVPWTMIAKWHALYKEGYDHELNPRGLSKVENRSYAPYADTQLPIKINLGKKRSINSSPLIELLIKVKALIHPWIRINRIVRDIPGLYITGGNEREDLRAILGKEIEFRKARGDPGIDVCKCIRCREIRNGVVEGEPELVVREYNASHGKEYFISFETNNRGTILGFLRLRLPGININNANDDHNMGDDEESSKEIFPELEGVALIRELHVYGMVVPVKSSSTNNASQHLGYGKRLIKRAESIASEHGYRKIAVIAGVGVRNYYRKLGYLDHDGEGNFQIKDLVLSTEGKPSNAITIAMFVLICAMLITICLKMWH